MRAYCTTQIRGKGPNLTPAGADLVLAHQKVIDTMQEEYNPRWKNDLALSFFFNQVETYNDIAEKESRVGFDAYDYDRSFKSFRDALNDAAIWHFTLHSRNL